ncbi:MAG: HDIG domain-containing metalloprotein [Solirubrobacteraceae bacterium]
MGIELSRPEAWTLVCEWIASESLRRHCLAVEAAMRHKALAKAADLELWGITGLLHDLDYERYPDPESGHPRVAMKLLAGLGYPAQVVRAIGSHADYMGIARESDMEIALAAVDELCGFIMACAYVRPQGIHGLTPTSVKKKLKSTAFAASVSRADIYTAATRLNVDFDEHLRDVIAALQPHAASLGIDGRPD